MKRINHFRATMLCASLALGANAFLTIGGCQPAPTELAPQATDQLAVLRTQIFGARAQIQGASNAARDLLDQPRQDLTPQINLLVSQVAALNANRAETRANAQAFDQSTNAYFAQWEQTLQGMSEETATAGQQRLALVKDTVKRLREKAMDVRAHIGPFMSDINEAAKYLSTDTTRAGVDIVKPKLRSAVDGEKAILQGFDELVSTIDKIRAGR